MRHRVMPWIAGLSTAIITMFAAITAQAAQPYELTVLESTPGFFDLPLRNAIADFAPKLNLNVKLITVTGGGGLATEFEGGTGDIAMVAADTPLRLAQANAVPGGVTIVGTNMTNMLYALVAKQGSLLSRAGGPERNECRDYRRRRSQRGRVEVGAQDQSPHGFQ